MSDSRHWLSVRTASIANAPRFKIRTHTKSSDPKSVRALERHGEWRRSSRHADVGVRKRKRFRPFAGLVKANALIAQRDMVATDVCIPLDDVLTSKYASCEPLRHEEPLRRKERPDCPTQSRGQPGTPSSRSVQSFSIDVEYLLQHSCATPAVSYRAGARASFRLMPRRSLKRQGPSCHSGDQPRLISLSGAGHR